MGRVAPAYGSVVRDASGDIRLSAKFMPPAAWLELTVNRMRRSGA